MLFEHTTVDWTEGNEHCHCYGYRTMPMILTIDIGFFRFVHIQSVTQTMCMVFIPIL